MSWEKIDIGKVVSRVAIGLRKTSRGGIQKIIVSIPSTLAGKVWDKADRAEASWGTAEHDGFVRVEPSSDGPFGITRFKSHLLISFRSPLSPRPERKAQPCECQRDGDAFILALPEWITKRDPALPPPPVTDVEHKRLKVVGRYLVHNDKNFPLGESQAKFIDALIKAHPNSVPSSAGDKLIGGVKALPPLNAIISEAGLMVTRVTNDYRLKGMPA